MQASLLPTHYQPTITSSIPTHLQLVLSFQPLSSSRAPRYPRRAQWKAWRDTVGTTTKHGASPAPIYIYTYVCVCVNIYIYIIIYIIHIYKYIPRSQMSTSKTKKNNHNPPQSGHPNLCTGLSPGMSVGSSKTSQCQCCPAPSVLWNNLPCLGQAAKHSRSSALPATVFASLNPLASSNQCWNCTEQTWGLDLTNLQSFSMDFYACFPLFSHGESTMWDVLHSCPSKSIIVHGSGGTCREITR